MRSSKRYWQFKQESKNADKKFTISPRLRSTCNLTAFCMFVYSLVERDIPVALVALAVMTGTIPVLDFLGDNFARSLQRVMQAFSITLFIGAVLLIFY